nr:EF-hand calcium-binding domain-containing protein 6 isoform X2 [Pelodiscus sinensis]XP_025042845.1 EF-hand calcium-binding domain-containing protein 6 isoform X3 [Pelodiscus sinensis]|eukprot:XP_025042844.1 EF-hand calcium-binding domain-containing protein 6 isoform X2 [Pelodiscus sinensis]
MARVVSAEDFSGLRPYSQGIIFTARPSSTPSRASSCRSRQSSIKSASSTSVRSVPDPTLSSSDIEQILLQKTAEKEGELKKAFQTIDIDQAQTVTKGEFRRVIETFLFPLTQAQFDAVLAQIPMTSKVTIPYLDFLAKFTRVAKSNSMQRRWNGSQGDQTMTLSQLESLLKEKISKNLKSIVKTCRLFDYNRTGQIQRHELRRILEISCFRMKDAEYEKLWSRSCVGKTNTLDYKEFLKNLGINLGTIKSQAPNWEETPDKMQKQNKLSLQTSPTECSLIEYTLDDIEMAFRKKLHSAYQNIEKAFRAFDVSQSGFVSSDYLKSVINGFVFPLPNGTFQELMNRFGFKATGKIAWHQFLQKFQNPVIYENRQIIPIRKNHRVNPIRVMDEAFSSDRVLLKLRRHIQSAYPSLKQAFLMIDTKKDGKITRNELRRILDCILFRISDKDFQDLINMIDPDHTGFLSYHTFLDLFEEKESLGEDILSDKITENWKDFHKALQTSDPKCTGIISRNQLRKIVQLYCPSLSDEQFTKLCHKFQDIPSDGILYRMLLESLGVALLLGDLNGVSTQISKGSQQREEKRQTDLSKRMKQIEDQATKHTKNRTVDEVIERLKNSVIQQEATIKDSFLAYKKQPNGKISKDDFRKVLEDHGMPMDDSQFNLLTEKLGFPNGGLSYLDFVAVFEDPRLNGPGTILSCSPNHRVNSTKFYYLTAEECLSQFNAKLTEEYEDMYSAFRKADSNHDGIISMLDLRSLLESFVFILTNEEYSRLLGILGLNLNSTLNYHEFVQLFQNQETKEVHPWLNPSHKPKQTITDAELACDQAHYYLVIKAQTRWHDLARTFREFDSKGNGIVQPEDLRAVLFRFAIPITPKEFEKLWARYDTVGKGYLTHQEFLQKLGLEFAPSDTGLSRHIAEDSYATLMEHYSNQQKKHWEMEEQQKQQTKDLYVNEITKQIKDKFRDYFQDFNKAFYKLDKNKDGYITVDDLHRMLQEFNYYLDDEQFNSLLNRLGISIHDSKLSYFDFLRAIDDGRASKYQQRQKPAAPPASFAMLSLEKTLIKIKEIVTSSYDLLYKAFSLFDKEGTGAVTALEFHQVLDHFCFKLTDKQFRHLLKKLKLYENHTVDWKFFLKNCDLLLETEEGQKVAQPKSSQELSKKEILTRIQEVVTARFNTITQEFKDTDCEKVNTVSKEDFRGICNRYFLLLTDGQFEDLWNSVSVDADGRLKYCDFLKKFNCEAVTMPSDTQAMNSAACPSKPATPAEPGSRLPSQPSRPKTAASPSVQVKTPVSSRPHTAVAWSPPLLNCEPIENKIRKIIQHSWREILKACKEKDVDRLGEVSKSDFLAIAEKFNLNLSKEEFSQITTKYDIKNNDRFAYCDFLQSCVLLMKPQESSLLQRMSIQKPRISRSPGPQTLTFFNAMLRIQPQILHCWRPMRRTFKSYDESGSGLLSVQDFRQVLHRYHINLTEEEFFHILEFYDKSLSSKISYNDFLRAFLQ